MMRIDPPAAVRASDAGAEVTASPATSPPPETDTEQRAERRLLLQRLRFDLAGERRAELMREENAMRDMMMAQLKDEDAYIKKWIEMI